MTGFDALLVLHLVRSATMHAHSYGTRTRIVDQLQVDVATSCHVHFAITHFEFGAANSRLTVQISERIIKQTRTRSESFDAVVLQ